MIEVPQSRYPELPLPLRNGLKKPQTFLQEFWDIFAVNLKSPQLTKLATHSIDTGSAQPVKHNNRVENIWSPYVTRVWYGISVLFGERV